MLRPCGLRRRGPLAAALGLLRVASGAAVVAFRCLPCLLVVRRRGGSDFSDGAAAGGSAVAAHGRQPFATLEYADGTAVDMDGSATAEDDYGGEEDGYYTDEVGV